MKNIKLYGSKGALNMTRLRKGILLAGDIEKSDTTKWKKWFDEINEIFAEHNISLYGILVDGEGFSGKIYNKKYVMKRLMRSFSEQKDIEALGFFAYDPKHEHVNNGDLVIFMRLIDILGKGRIWCEFNDDTFSDEEIIRIVNILKPFVDITYGEIIQKDTGLDTFAFIGRLINYDDGYGPIEEDNDEHITTLKIVQEELVKIKDI